jgi:hypothetical protein
LLSVLPERQLPPLHFHQLISAPIPNAAAMMSHHLIGKDDDYACLRGVENGRQPDPPGGLIVNALVLSGAAVKCGAKRTADPVN